MNRYPVVVAITGASGSAYAVRLLQILLQQQQSVDLIVSEAGRQVMLQETGLSFPLETASQSDWKSLIAGGFSDNVTKPWSFDFLEPEQLTGLLRVHPLRDFSAGIASGSHQTQGMVICPC